VVTSVKYGMIIDLQEIEVRRFRHHATWTVCCTPCTVLECEPFTHAFITGPPMIQYASDQLTGGPGGLSGERVQLSMTLITDRYKYCTIFIPSLKDEESWACSCLVPRSKARHHLTCSESFNLEGCASAGRRHGSEGFRVMHAGTMLHVGCVARQQQGWHASDVDPGSFSESEDRGGWHGGERECITT
jgi:hypothetical protein